MLEMGVHEIPLQLEAVLETQRSALQQALLAAQRRLAAFARRHHWQEYVAAPFARQARIYASKKLFDHDLLCLCGLDPALELPATYCAALEQEILVCVAPEIYRAVYPEGDEPHAYEKLLAHEMAHRLHIRLLNGDEEAMGPVWFYEGFALHAASQFEHTAPQLSPDEIWSVVNDPERAAYRRYASVFQHFLRQTSLPELVARAGKAGFIRWLRRLPDP